MANDGKLHPQCDLAPVLDQMDEIIAQAVRVLKEPMPDTFLGRKTHEPFPKEEQD